ncbi:hypothetical protein D0T49_00975 [Paludibacter sp. 221]|uniref:WbqC family protein n=1 Tax=Paludibacter sp. 221 TaxID=2302939 RepID=UPI0013CF4217|nr:WbqC family protein [Paludibacter sp. 221]NDV45627.1 hypothetical protein [Paludibacter sp. 221]
MQACLTTAYLAPTEYYLALAKADKIFLEHHDNYVKQTYRNRCRIATANGTMDLTIPVEKISGEKQLTRDVKISYYNDWQVQHWRSIESAYNSTPFFEYYKDDFMPLYEKKWTFLWDFNHALMDKAFELLDLTPRIILTETYQPVLAEGIVDLRERIHPKKESDEKTNFKKYYQVFEQKLGFIPNLSIIDLLFNMGNEAVLVLEGDKRRKEK